MFNQQQAHKHLCTADYKQNDTLNAILEQYTKFLIANHITYN